MGFHVVREGDRVAVWSVGGHCEFVDGPAFLFTVLKRVQRLQSFAASQYQYLNVLHIDGHVENIPGPCSMFFNPLIHKNVIVRDAVSLSAHEVLVVYCRDGDGRGERGNVRGKGKGGERMEESTIEMLPMEEGRGGGGMGYAESDARLMCLENVKCVIVKGPKIHFPSNFEWTHKFEWHGEDPARKAHVVPRAQIFEKLSLIPSSFYYNVSDVRT